MFIFAEKGQCAFWIRKESEELHVKSGNFPGWDFFFFLRRKLEMRGALFSHEEILLGQHSLRYKVWRKIACYSLCQDSPRQNAWI